MPLRGTILSLFNMTLPQKQMLLGGCYSLSFFLLSPFPIAGAVNYQVLFSVFEHLVLDFLLLGIILSTLNLYSLFPSPLFH